MAKPQTAPPYKLSPSSFKFGFDNCKRCYYLAIRQGLQEPGGFPSVFSKYDIVHKKSTTGKKTTDIIPTMPSGTFIKGPGDKFLESKNIDFGGDKVGYISGKGDAFLELDDGTYAVVDFKTSALTMSGALSYSSQLHAYKYALENNKETKPGLRPITKLGIICFVPDINLSMQKVEHDIYSILHKASWFEVPIDNDSFIGYIEKVVTLLALQDVPEASEGCRACAYRKKGY
tara:strand:+ start:2164 stop:2856 length:693 start_codon:yes stop_codon:yes gene_type:complete